MNSILKKRRGILLTGLTDAAAIWILVHFGLGGWRSAISLLTDFGLLSWAILLPVLAFIIYRSDYRMDIPLFLAGFVLGYWGESGGGPREASGLTGTVLLHHCTCPCSGGLAC
jgi:hypothetical protein